jgi:hypothetical protein
MNVAMLNLRVLFVNSISSGVFNTKSQRLKHEIPVKVTIRPNERGDAEPAGFIRKPHFQRGF